MTKEEFLKSYDFLKLGENINHSNWQAAYMAAGRMQKNAAEAGIDTFNRQLIGIRQCINARQKTEALNILTLMVNKRVQMLKSIALSPSEDISSKQTQADQQQ